MNAALKMLGVSFITFTQLVVTADLRADDCRSTFRAVRHPYRSSFRFNDQHDSFRSNNDRRHVSNSCNSSRRDNSRRLPLQRENSVQFAPTERRFSDSPTTRNRETQPSARENISTRPVGGNRRTTQSVDAQPVGGNRQATQSARLSLEPQRRPPQAQPRGFTNQPNESVVPKSPTAISWFHDLDDAFRKDRSGRNLIVKFGAKWCGPCQQMARDTLTNRSVISTIDKNLTAVSIDIDQHQRLAAQFNIQSVPTVLVLSPEGRILQRTTGYQSATQLLKTIQPFTRSAQPSRSPIVRNERR